MAERLIKAKAGFGTAPVFLTAISTILGAILFLRFGYAVANTGFIGTVGIIILGHVVTIATALALAEIATNQRVEGGGEYFIISRSFGLEIGGAIGIALFLSQAISVAFYVIAFGEALTPLIDFLQRDYGIAIVDKRLFTLPATLILALIIILKGANLGVRVLYVVVGLLAISLLMFFLGGPIEGAESSHKLGLLSRMVDDPDRFFLVFAICFPGFTGMTAGVGLSGDLKNPRKSIPIGTLSATLLGMVVYIGVAYKLTISASPADLAGDQLIMSRIAVWGPIIPIGLAAATVSSALGSAMVAPRTLQAVALDQLFPSPRLNRALSRGRPNSNEPTNASIVVFVIAGVFVALGSVDFVAQIISMIFMLSYGSLCTISLLEHFAADPSYRPSFRSRWYISLVGALMCVWLMFRMSAPYAVLALVIMGLLYVVIARTRPDRGGLARLFRGAMFQFGRQLQIVLHRSSRNDAQRNESWRPAAICMSASSFERLDALDMLRWISYRFGSAIYIHLVEAYLSRASLEESRDALERLHRLSDLSGSNIYMDTLINPSYGDALGVVAQLPGLSGTANNLILFEFDKDAPEELDTFVKNYRILTAADFDMCVLAVSDRGFGYRHEIHVWITPTDFDNAPLMILLSYILLGHPDWDGAEIKLFAVFPEEEIEEEKERMLSLVRSGRLPISAKNIELIVRRPTIKLESLIQERSRDADLTMLGFIGEEVRRRKTDAFTAAEGLGNILFVSSTHEIELYDEDEDQEVSLIESEALTEAKEAVEPEEPQSAHPEAAEVEHDEEGIRITDSLPDPEQDDPERAGELEKK
jgi:amino acid transporter